jgi:hypothetical protein
LEINPEIADTAHPPQLQALLGVDLEPNFPSRRAHLSLCNLPTLPTLTLAMTEPEELEEDLFADL